MARLSLTISTKLEVTNSLSENTGLICRLLQEARRRQSQPFSRGDTNSELLSSADEPMMNDSSTNSSISANWASNEPNADAFAFPSSRSSSPKYLSSHLSSSYPPSSTSSSSSTSSLSMTASGDSGSKSPSVIVGGHDLTQLRRFALRLRQKRRAWGMSQTQLSHEMMRFFPGYLLFSQSLLCRFEKLDVTLRAALRLVPYLSRWLEHAENQRCESNIFGPTDKAGSDTSLTSKTTTSPIHRSTLGTVAIGPFHREPVATSELKLIW
ncbi:unnamed protein product [Protopolystoma xenopodis]|uniref:POU-specific domain-containing protein n=1 Tax=Protopolystoma xenopodis TaxID=117903 RepID=A0A3S5A5K3_9PLAT|nr:unnamed protein product [Protopolystoma xenopodis]